MRHRTMGAFDYPEKPSRRFHMPYWMKLLCAVAAFALLFKLVDLTTLKDTMARSHRGFLAAGVGVAILGQFIASQRWRSILRRGSIQVGPASIFRISLIGTFFGNFLPGQGSGDMVKCGLLFGEHPDRRPFLIASVFYDRAMGLLSMVEVAAFAGLLLGSVWDLRVMQWLGLLALFGTPVALLVLRSLSNSKTLRIRFPCRRFGGVAAFAGEFVQLCRDVPLALRCLALSLVFQFLSVLTLWLMLAAVMPRPPFLPVLLSGPLSILIAVVPISPGGLGVREGMFTFIMHRFGFDGATVAAAAVLGLLPLIATSIAGGLLFLFGRKHEAREDSF